MEKHTYIRKTVTWQHHRYEARIKPSRQPAVSWPSAPPFPLRLHRRYENRKETRPPAAGSAATGRAFGVSETQLLVYRASMVAISARVAVSWGSRVPSGVPVRMPSLTAHSMARLA